MIHPFSTHSSHSDWGMSARGHDTVPSAWRLRSAALRRPYATTTLSRHRDETESIHGTCFDESVTTGDEDPRIARMRVEAVLLVSKTPLSPRKLAMLAGLADATSARTAVRRLNELYDALGRAIRVETVAGGYRLFTRSALAPWLSRLSHLPPPLRLSSPMLETLAVVAYRQPVSRADAESIRGVACGELLRQLMERDLVRIAGRGEELGRPYLYGTTKRFLQIFGLQTTDALPPIRWQTLNDDSDRIPNEDTSPEEPVVTIAPHFDETLNDLLNPMTSIGTNATMLASAPSSAIEDEEDELYEGDDDEWEDEDDDWDDPDDEDDAEEEDEESEEETESESESEVEEEAAEDLEDEEWEEVDDDDAEIDDEEVDDEEEEFEEEEFEEDDDEWEEEDDAEEEEEDEEEDWE
jgi:segregation and condensation protein B